MHATPAVESTNTTPSPELRVANTKLAKALVAVELAVELQQHT